MTRPTLATIDTSALAHNANWLKSSANGAKLMAVVKADAYGHDVRIVAPALDGIADGFAVAHLDEAVELRGLKITKPILVLEGAFSESEYAEARSQNVTLALTDDWQAGHYLSMPAQNARQYGSNSIAVCTASGSMPVAYRNYFGYSTESNQPYLRTLRTPILTATRHSDSCTN